MMLPCQELHKHWTTLLPSYHLLPCQLEVSLAACSYLPIICTTYCLPIYHPSFNMHAQAQHMPSSTSFRHLVLTRAANLTCSSAWQLCKYMYMYYVKIILANHLGKNSLVASLPTHWNVICHFNIYLTSFRWTSVLAHTYLIFCHYQSILGGMYSDI
jgi:hypothetical protein